MYSGEARRGVGVKERVRGGEEDKGRRRAGTQQHRVTLYELISSADKQRS